MAARKRPPKPMSNMTLKSSLRACCPQPLRPYWDRVEASPVGYRLAKGAFWSLVGMVVVRAGGMVGIILTGRILGQSRLGELGMIRSTMLVFGLLAGAGLGIAGTKNVAEFRRTDPERAGRLIRLLLNTSLLLGGLATLVCFLLAPILASAMAGAGQLTGPMRIGSCLLVLYTLTGVQLGLLAGFEAFRTIARLSLIQGLLNLVLVPAGAWGFGTGGAIGGCVIATAAGLVVNQLALRRECYRAGAVASREKKPIEWQALWVCALPAVLAGFIVQTFDWLVKLMLARTPDGFAEVGLLVAATSWGTLIQILPLQILNPARPVLANLYAEGDIRSFRRVILTYSALALMLGIAAAVPMMLLASHLMGAYGASFSAGAGILVMILAINSVSSVTAVFGVALEASGRMWSKAFLLTAYGFCLLAIAPMFLNRGALGLTYAYAISQAVYVFLGIIAVSCVIRPMRTHDKQGPHVFKDANAA